MRVLNGEGAISGEYWCDEFGETGEPGENFEKSRHYQPELNPWRHRDYGRPKRDR